MSLNKVGDADAFLYCLGVINDPLESLSKAIGTGFREGLNFKDITIANDKRGKPYYKLNNNVKKLIYSIFKVKKIKISLSLADEKKYSIAFSMIHK